MEKKIKIGLGLSVLIIAVISVWLFLLPKIIDPLYFSPCIFDGDCVYSHCCGCINKNARCRILCSPIMEPWFVGPSYECKCINFRCQRGEPKLESYIKGKISSCQLLCERILTSKLSEEEIERYKDIYCNYYHPVINKRCWEDPINVECNITCD